jgi:hypothetical protein
MAFVKARDFVLYHEVSNGPSRGWTIAFALHYTANRGNVPQVWATSPTGRTIRDPKRVALIMPVTDWPEFARKTLSQEVEGFTQEGLF